MDRACDKKMSDARSIPADEEDDDPRPLPRHLPEVEYEDEPPGAYLAELRAGAWTVVWGVANALLEAAVAVAWFLGALAPGVSARAPVEVVWALLPVSAGIAFVVSGWLAVIDVRSSPSRSARWSLALAALTLIGWWVLRDGFGVLPPLEENAAS